jgi:hypothetical protein
MTFVRASIVGHFDPCDFTASRFTPERPVDRAREQRLLADYGDEVAQCIRRIGGYVWCEWSANFPVSDLVREFAERLADEEGCVVLETPAWWCRYPAAAVERQSTACTAWWEAHDGAAMLEAAEHHV